MKRIVLEKIPCRQKGYFLYKIKCLYCGKIKTIRGSRFNAGAGYFCNRKCSGLYRSVKKIEFRCAYCGKRVYRFPCEVNKSGKYYCDYDCKHKDKDIVSFKCAYCGKQSKKSASRYYCSKKHFCSKTCLNKSFNRRVNTTQGYIQVRQPRHPYSVNGYVLEHRLVMEKHLGRYLKPTEIIHHVDEDRSNNSIKNLMLFSSNKEHLIYHSKYSPSEKG